MIRRPHISLKVKLEVALRQLGLDPATAQLDHRPPLKLRTTVIDKDGYRYHPDANDPRYLMWLAPEAHLLRTTGKRGTSKLSKRGGDLSEIAKLKRTEADEAAFRERLLKKRPGKPREKSKRWPSRKIPHRNARDRKATR